MHFQFVLTLAQDVSGSAREVKIKIVNEKYEVSRRLLALTDIKGCKTSLGKVGQIKDTLNEVFEDDADRDAFARLFLSFSADGEKAELLTGDFAKVP